MSMQNLLNQFMGSTNETANTGTNTTSNVFSKITSNIPGGLMGGAAAGGIMALLMSNKKARKIAGTAASVGGAAVIGGLAYKAYKNWQNNNSDNARINPQACNDALQKNTEIIDIDLYIIKAMIAAAKSDGHIDSIEQQRIFKSIEQMKLSSEMKAVVFDLLNKPISVKEITDGVHDMTLKSEIYLASCLVIDNDHPLEQAHLNSLANALELPQGLSEQIMLQAQKAINQIE